MGGNALDGRGQEAVWRDSSRAAVGRHMAYGVLAGGGKQYAHRWQEISPLGLAFMMFQMSTTHEKIAMEKSLRKHFKRFCCLPQGTPNKIINKLISTIDELSKSAEVYSECKLKSHT